MPAKLATSDHVRSSRPSHIVLVALTMIAAATFSIYRMLNMRCLVLSLSAYNKESVESKAATASPTTTPANDSDVTAAAVSRVGRPSFLEEVTDGGIHACARISTRYEASHLLQWLYYHKRIGISFFHLYVTYFSLLCFRFFLLLLHSCTVDHADNLSFFRSCHNYADTLTKQAPTLAIAKN